ncbi:MAG: FlgO family outer membrane protein [Planctomycetes bacterium]|nr:FlgO family outer membrane protein [Planctomycetota bacterium]
MPGFMTSGVDQYGGGFDSATGMRVGSQMSGSYNGQPVRQAEGMRAGVLMPDGRGGYVWLASDDLMSSPSAQEAAARELKLKVRELVDQIFATPLSDEYRSAVALPVSFVNMDNFEESSSFGRYIAEQMYYELNQRGFQVKEYRNNGKITVKKGSGEFYLSHAKGTIGFDGANVVLLGTYYSDKDTVFVNARLVKANGGAVIRSALITFPQTQLSKRMIARKQARRLEAANVNIKPYKKPDASGGAAAAIPTVIDAGSDIH